jgi:ubiquinone/menaquinone biosynthesis C-methylase UbiE
MYKNIIKILKCPDCNQKFQIVDDDKKTEKVLSGQLSCGCTSYKEILDGVLILSLEEQKNANEWTQLRKKLEKFENIDKLVAAKTPKNQMDLVNKTCDFIGDYIDKEQPEFLVDVASGRGMLLNHLLRNKNIDISSLNIICTDLSYSILQYDRKKFDQLSKNFKISYISCNAISLPFVKNSIDMMISLMGYPNMGILMESALVSTFNALKNGGSLLNACLSVDDNSVGFKIAKKYWDEHNAVNAEKNILKSGILDLHQIAGFKKTQIKAIGESIGEKNELDLLPYENEKFSIDIYLSQKE